MKQIFMLLTLITLSQTAVSMSIDHPLIKEYPSAKLFQQSHETYEKVALVGGPIEYKKGADEGYMATSIIDVVGEAKQYIHDYDKTYSSMHIAQEMERQLLNNKFELLYKCAEDECGDLSGWQLYLSRLIAV